MSQVSRICGQCRREFEVQAHTEVDCHACDPTTPHQRAVLSETVEKMAEHVLAGWDLNSMVQVSRSGAYAMLPVWAVSA